MKEVSRERNSFVISRFGSAEIPDCDKKNSERSGAFRKTRFLFVRNYNVDLAFSSAEPS